MQREMMMVHSNENKIPISIRWIKHQDGSLEPEVNIDIDDFIEFDGSVVEEIKKFKTNYQKLLNKADKLKIATKHKKSKKIWRLCKILADFNEQIESKFIIQDSMETFSKDIGMSLRYIKNCINFANYFSYYDVSDDVQFGYYNAVTDCAATLERKGLLKKEKQFLKECGATNSLPTRVEYRKTLQKIIKENP
jgi:hypothetical protein